MAKISTTVNDKGSFVLQVVFLATKLAYDKSSLASSVTLSIEHEAGTQIP